MKIKLGEKGESINVRDIEGKNKNGTDYSDNKMFKLWSKFDEKYMKRIFGGSQKVEPMAQENSPDIERAELLPQTESGNASASFDESFSDGDFSMEMEEKVLNPEEQLHLNDAVVKSTRERALDFKLRKFF